MAFTRRRLFFVAGAAAAFAVTETAVRAASEAAGRAVATLRPAPDGTSTTRCSLCGSSDHTMLDGRCPMARPGGRR